jgi:hypothetical protein
MLLPESKIARTFQADAGAGKQDKINSANILYEEIIL